MTRAQQPWFAGPDRAVGTRLRSIVPGGALMRRASNITQSAARSCDCTHKNETPKSALRDRRRNPGLRPRFCDTETGPYAAYAPCPRVLRKVTKLCTNKDLSGWGVRGAKVVAVRVIGLWRG